MSLLLYVEQREEALREALHEESKQCEEILRKEKLIELDAGSVMSNRRDGSVQKEQHDSSVNSSKHDGTPMEKHNSVQAEKHDSVPMEKHGGMQVEQLIKQRQKEMYAFLQRVGN